MNNNRRIAGVIVLVTIIIVGISVLTWASQQSRLVLTQASTAGESTYQITKQGEKNPLTFKDSQTSVQKNLTKGSYEVLVQNSAGSFFAVVSQKGFFHTTRVEVKPSPEHARVFIGKSPSLCMDSIKNSLFSYDCPSGTYGQVKYHLPSTQQAPTYAVSPGQIGSFTNIEGVFDTPEGNFVLMKNTTALIDAGDGGSSGGNTNTPSIHEVFALNSAADITNLPKMKGVGLAGLDAKTLYSVRSYGDGFLVYTPDFSHIYYYASAKSQPIDMTLGGPKGKGLIANQTNFDASNNTIFTTYSQGDLGETTSVQQKPARTELVYGQPGSAKHYTLKGYLAGAQLCGTQKACLLDSHNTLTVYDISGKEPKPLYSVDNINYIQNSPHGLLALNKSQKFILNLDADSRTGYIDYSFGDYTFNRLQTTQGGYVLSLTDNKKQELALFVDAQKPNTDSIDKKILELQKDPILTATAYGNVIYITPYIGSLAYNNISGSYEYDPGTKSTALAKMNQAIDSAGIDRKTYLIVSTVR